MAKETPKEMLERWRLSGLYDPECPGCKAFKGAVDRNQLPWTVFAPSHTASPLCESGSRTHCTCDRCF